MTNIGFRLTSYVALLAVLAACSTVQLNTNVFPSPQKQPDKIFVILTAPEAWRDNVKAFTKPFSEQLQRCGTQTDVYFDVPQAETLSLKDDNNANERLLSEETAFSPDAVMSIKWTSVQTAGNGYIQGINFNLGLVWRAPAGGGVPWQGAANVPSGGWLFTGGGSDLASAIFNDLRQKGLLPKCPATTD